MGNQGHHVLHFPGCSGQPWLCSLLRCAVCNYATTELCTKPRQEVSFCHLQRLRESPTSSLTGGSLLSEVNPAKVTAHNVIPGKLTNNGISIYIFASKHAGIVDVHQELVQAQPWTGSNSPVTTVVNLMLHIRCSPAQALSLGFKC